MSDSTVRYSGLEFICLKIHNNSSSYENYIVISNPKLLWPVFCSFLKFGQPVLVIVLMMNF